MPSGQPLILTLRLDQKNREFFNARRREHFPVGKNLVDAHLTLFHQLPDEQETIEIVKAFDQKPFIIEVIGLMNLGAGIAYRLESKILQELHKNLSGLFARRLIPQDRQGFRPHITVMNKSTPEKARELMSVISAGFHPFFVGATGLSLWIYQDGPWQHVLDTDFL